METVNIISPEIINLENINFGTIVLLCVVLFFCLLFLLVGRSMGLRQGRKLEAAEWEGGRLREIVKTRLKQSRAVLGGLVSEQNISEVIFLEVKAAHQKT